LQTKLGQLEKRALAWVLEHLTYFNPLRYSEMLKLDLGIKASAELALVCDYACTNPSPDTVYDYKRLASYLWSQVFCAPEVRDYLFTTELGLLTFNFYASLRECGFRDDEYECKLREFLKDGYVSAAERIATRDLDLIHSLQKLGLEYRHESVAEVYAKSLLAQYPPLYPLTTDDIYAITHVIFFVTDFGRVSGYFSPPDMDYLRMALPRLLRYCLRKGNWDLTAELMICLQAADLTDVPEYRRALELLVTVQEDDGSFAGPVGDQQGRALGLPGRRLISTPSRRGAAFTTTITPHLSP
jgi:hypothetical protein